MTRIKAAVRVKAPNLHEITHPLAINLEKVTSFEQIAEQEGVNVLKLD